MKKGLIFLLLLFFAEIFAQNQANHWYFGENAGLDFTNGDPVADTNGALSTNEGCASISDFDGNLLFYTDGITIWNANHQIMQNGTGLYGNPSSTQSGMIVPFPNDTTKYYVFTMDEPDDVDSEEDIHGMNYSIVDMTLAGGLGAVTTKNTHLITYDENIPLEKRFKCSEKITAVKHANGTDFWVITHFTNKYYAFLVNGTGVQNPVISSTPLLVPLSGYRKNAIGYLKASPNGEYLAVAHSSTGIVSQSDNQGKLMMYDFDSSTGTVSNEILVDEFSVYGVEFSPNSKVLYASSRSNGAAATNQYDLENNLTKVVISNNGSSSGALQLGPNGKIYRAMFDTSFLDVINEPNNIGAACDYQISAVSLNGRTCVFGLPPFIQSYFLQTEIDVEIACAGEATAFSYELDAEGTVVTSQTWDFGDAGSAQNTSTLANPSHIYTQAGQYTITLILTLEDGTTRTYTETLEIFDYPVIQDFTIPACSETNTGIFDLTTYPSYPINGWETHFYPTLTDAENDTNEISNISQYESTETLIYVVVDNHSCTASAVINLEINSTPMVEIDEIYTICKGETQPIEVSNEWESYLWSNGATTHMTSFSESGTYTLTVTEGDCSNTYTFQIVVDEIPEPEVLTFPNSFQLNFYNYEPSLEFSLDDLNWQTSHIFSGLDNGEYTVYIRNEFGCEKVITVELFEISNTFTPNDDGINDEWKLSGLTDGQSSLQIFDRYGKLLYHTTSKNKTIIWNGKLSGRPLPTDSYWYILTRNSYSTIYGWVFIKNYTE